MPGKGTDLYQEVFGQGASGASHRMRAGSRGAYCQRIYVVKFHLRRKGNDYFDKRVQPDPSVPFCTR